MRTTPKKTDGIEPGLGSLSRGKLGLRVVVSSTTEGRHQPVGDESSSFGLVSFQSNSPSQISRRRISLQREYRMKQ
jgi:hypothetical protein